MLVIFGKESLELTARARHRRHGQRMQIVDALEQRLMLSAAFPEFVDPNPALGNRFGDTVLPLSTGNVVITSPGDDVGGNDAGAVYLFNGATGSLISTLTGSSSSDGVGSHGLQEVGAGNFVVISPLWGSRAGAVTFGDGNAGVAGVVSDTNSLVGTPHCYVGVFSVQRQMKCAA